MRIVYFDCFAGISGDMVAGSFLDLGLDPQDLERELRKLPFDGFKIGASSVERGGIQATAFSVELEGEDGYHLADADFRETEEPGLPDSIHAAEHPPSRSLQDILKAIRESGLSERVKLTASAIFNKLGSAEAKVHGMPVDHVHFHEVGGLDAIVDVTSAAIGLEKLGVEAVFASPLHLGGGFVRSSHGVLPVPAPATAELLTGVPVFTSQVRGELVTPTGAAILTTLARGFGSLPDMTVQKVGYGAGSRQRSIPNVLRAFLGEAAQAGGGEGAGLPISREPHPQQHLAPEQPGGYHDSPAVVLEANIDDSSPQLFENLVDRLLAAGAMDVSLVPIQMKKNRPAVLLQVLASPESVDRLLQIVFRESTTIGVRSYPVTKHMLRRETLAVTSEVGVLRLKVSFLGEQVVSVTPEYEDCRRLAAQSGRPLKEVYRLALAAYERGGDSSV